MKAAGSDVAVLKQKGGIGTAGSDVEIGIIAGSGVYDPAFLKSAKAKKVSTHFGEPSDAIQVGEFFGKRVAFLNRHGPRHSIPPHAVNYRANVWALKQLGVKRIVSICAVGSLQEKYKPGEFVFADQFVDFTKRRASTFFDGPRVVHVSCAEPFCPELRSLLASKAKKLDLPFHDQGTYACIEGPRFSTKAESQMFRQFGDIIGMTLVPEVVLAREAELCFASVGMVTDYDVWKKKPVSIEEVVGVMKQNLGSVKRLLEKVMPAISEKRSCGCSEALKDAKA